MMSKSLQYLPQLQLKKMMKKVDLVEILDLALSSLHLRDGAISLLLSAASMNWIILVNFHPACVNYQEVQIARSRSVFTVKCGSDFEENLELLNDNGGNQRSPNWRIFKTEFVLEDFFSISDERNNIEVQDVQNIHDDGCLVSFF